MVKSQLQLSLLYRLSLVQEVWSSKEYYYEETAYENLTLPLFGASSLMPYMDLGCNESIRIQMELFNQKKRSKAFYTLRHIFMFSCFYLPWLQFFFFFSTNVSNEKMMRKHENSKTYLHSV